MYYKICESCGAVLDPGEKCDCETRETFSQDQDTIEYGFSAKAMCSTKLFEAEPQTEEWYTWQDEQEYNDRWQDEPQTEREDER